MMGNDHPVLSAPMNGLTAALRRMPWRRNRARQRHELQHQLANTLQILASIVSLQARDADSQTARDVHVMIEAQIQAVALVQRRLAEAGDGQPPEAAGLITELCALLEAGLRQLPDASGLRVSCSVSRLALHPGHAMPVALLITAAAIRVANHAQPQEQNHGAAGPLALHVAASGSSGRIRVTIQSAGLGDLPVPRLATAMARQLRGALEQDTAGGNWSIAFAPEAP